VKIALETRVTERTPTVADWLRRGALPLALAGTAYLVLSWPALVELASFYGEDPDFSHGFLVPLISAAILWSNRSTLGALPARPSAAGLASVVFFLGVFFVGHLTRTNIIQRVALWGVLTSGCWAACGPALLKAKPFPFLFLALAIPPHHALLSSIRLGLKSYATMISADVLALLGVVATPQGNVLVVDQHRLEVADACSGIRSLMAIIATAFLFAYLFRTGALRGTLLVMTAIPVTILVNVLRIVIVAVALVRVDIDLTAGLSHQTLGLIVFCVSVAALWGSWTFYQWLFRWRTYCARPCSDILTESHPRSATPATAPRRPSGAEEGEAACRGRCGGGSASPATSIEEATP